MISIISFLISDVCLLVCVAFYSLLERKVLSYIQIRKGPNKVGLIGLPQPFADALKLFLKEHTKPVLSNRLLYIFSPIFSLIIALSLWGIYSSNSILIYFYLGLLFFLALSALNVYGTLISGWSSNSKYALLGALRGVAQTISYEVSMVLIMLGVVYLVGSYNLLFFQYFQSYYWMVFITFPLFLIWLVSIFAETNRAPFDFAEGESELVSGFNVEYSGGGFALIFMAEYASILLMSLVTTFLFLGGGSFLGYSWFGLMSLKVVFISFLFLWVRGSLPRFRYDQLMCLTWKGYLPFSLGLLSFSLGLSIFFF